MMSRLGYSVLLLSSLFSIVQEVNAGYGPFGEGDLCYPGQESKWYRHCQAVDWYSDPFNKKIYGRTTVVIINAFLKKKAQLWVKCQNQYGHDLSGVWLQPGERLEFEPHENFHFCDPGRPKSCVDKYWCYMDWIDPVDKKKYGLTLNAFGYDDNNYFVDGYSIYPLYDLLYEYVVNKDGVWFPILQSGNDDSPLLLKQTLKPGPEWKQVPY